MNAFASYAQQAAPKRPGRDERVATALEKRMAEKQRLTRAYRAAKRQDRTECLALEPRLRAFLRYLRTIMPSDGPELLDAIAASWLVTAPGRVRIFALELVSRRCDKINRALGFEPLDDPLPPDTSLYFEARALLVPGGRA